MLLINDKYNPFKHMKILSILYDLKHNFIAVYHYLMVLSGDNFETLFSWSGKYRCRKVAFQVRFNILFLLQE